VSADLVVDTTVRADAERAGRYHLELPNHWDYLRPSGGVVMTCALRAAEAAVGDAELRLASATAIFCTPIESGALVADARVLRRGGATVQVHVAMQHPKGEAGVELTATFCRERKGPDVKCVPFPRVRALADSPEANDGESNNPHARFRFYQQLECRIAEGERYWTQGLVPGPARYARWLRYKTQPRDSLGRLDRLALPPLIDTMPTALHRAIGPGPYRFYAPSLDLTTYTVDDTTREWLLVAVTVRRARAGWAIGDVEVWDDEGRFVAWGSQAMYLQSVAGEPPVIDASQRT
jgi:acyl-CoA thioesterase